MLPADKSFINDLFHSLESPNPEVVEEAKKQFHSFFNATKDAWLLHGLYHHYIVTNCIRIVEIFIGIPEPHEQFLFEKISESLKTPQKFQALTLLGHIASKNPTWTYKILRYPLMRDLIKLLRTETDIIPLVSALLTLVILLPIVAGLLGTNINLLESIFDVFVHLASFNTNNRSKITEGQLLHLQIGLYALFNRLYGMFPVNFICHLKQLYPNKEKHPVFSHTILPMLDTVKMHPLLVTADREKEILSSRWKTMEANDVIIECARYIVDNTNKSREEGAFRGRAASLRSKSSLDDSLKILEKAGASDSSISDNSHGLSREAWSAAATLHQEAHFLPSPTPSMIREAGKMTPGGSIRDKEVAASARRKTMDGSDVLEERARFTLEGSRFKEEGFRVRTASMRSRSSLDYSGLGDSRGDGTIHTAREEFRTSHPTSVPTTPLPSVSYLSQAEGSSPPEAGVEATPELTTNMTGRVPKNVNSVGLISYGQKEKMPSSPRKGDTRYFTFQPTQGDSQPMSASQYKLHRLQMERAQVAESTLEEVKGGAALGDKVETGTPDILSSNTDVEWSRCEEHGDGCQEGGVHLPDSKRVLQFTKRLRYYSLCHPDHGQLQPARSTGSSPGSGGLEVDTKVKRAVSCPEMKRATLEQKSSRLKETVEEEEKVNKEVVPEDKKERTFMNAMIQTEDLGPLFGYEHLFFPVMLHSEQPSSAPPDVSCPSFPVELEKSSPYSTIEQFLKVSSASNLNNKNPIIGELSDLKVCHEHIQLLLIQLQFEKHRREVHAERNRRLQGKWRGNSTAEELNTALKDQVALLQKDIENLRNELERIKIEAEMKTERIRENASDWQERCAELEKNCNCQKKEINRLKGVVIEGQRKYEQLSKEMQGCRAAKLEMQNSLQSALSIATSNRVARDELACLQQRLLMLGESETTLSHLLDQLRMVSTKHAQEYLLTRSYNHQVNELKQSVESSNQRFTSSKERIKYLEDELKNRDNYIMSQKEKHAAQLSSSESRLAEWKEKFEEIAAANAALEAKHLNLMVELKSCGTRKSVNSLVDASLKPRSSALSLPAGHAPAKNLSEFLQQPGGSSLPPRDRSPPI